MNVSEFIVQWFAQQGVRHVFTLSGGGIIYLLDALGKQNVISYTCCHHEQAVAIATEGYSRIADHIGVSFVTTGPGGTNAITGVAGSWMDSIPHFIISGQAFAKQTIGSTGTRQIGVQEINIIDLVKPITKYAVMVTDATSIRYHLEKAFYLATNGRPGPVWIDLPADVQMAKVEGELLSFDPSEMRVDYDVDFAVKVEKVSELLQNAKRPVIHIGQGVPISGGVQDFFSLVEQFQLPFVTARNAGDVVSSEHPFFIGRQGTWAHRAANYAVQNADLYIAIGTRLSLPQIGYDSKDFARNATKVIVDIDKCELYKPTIDVDIGIHEDARKFINGLRRALEGKMLSCSSWLQRCQNWKQRYPVMQPEFAERKDKVDTYYFIDVLSDGLEEGDIVVTDMGLSFQVTHQAFRMKKNQRLITNCGLAQMGYGLPAAIGAAIAAKKSVVCLTGDGGLQLNIQEFQTLVHNKIPVKVFVFSNDGYLTIKQTQEHNFNGAYVASEPSSGVSCPDFVKIAEAYGLPAYRIQNHQELRSTIKEIVKMDGPLVCDVIMDKDQVQVCRVSSKKLGYGKFEKKPLEDLYPFLPEEEHTANMTNE